MPATRPEDISNLIRLLNEARGSVGAFVAEDGAVDAFLPAVVDEVSPNEEGIGWLGAQDNLLSGADELLALSAVGVSVAAVVALIEGEAVKVAVLR